MATSSSSPANPLLVVYIILGCLISFLGGREPGTVPENIGQETAYVVIVICGFLTSYSLIDVMAVGLAKADAKYFEKSYKDLPTTIPEEVYLAQRVQTNQVEQIPSFVVASVCCAVFVDGTISGVLALLWAVLRRGYATAYRSGVGLPVRDMGLMKYTIPAYFLINSMLMASTIHALRFLLMSK